MAKRIWLPETGDIVLLLNGNVGAVDDIEPLWRGDSWTTNVRQAGRWIGDREICYSEDRQRWEEVE